MFLFSSLGLTATIPTRRCAAHDYPIANHVVPLYPPLTEINGVFSADITIGSQTLRAGVDTGSADTWFLTPDTNCTAIGTLQPVTPDQCGYSGPRWIPDDTFKIIPDVNFNNSYGTTETINGPLGYTKLVLGGLEIPKQEIGAAAYASVGNDFEGNVSGLLGLAYPADTTAYPGEDPSQDTICQGNSSCGPVPYSPLIPTIFSNNLTKPLFAIALSRSSVSGGIMTLGGIPHIHDAYVNATDANVATVPIEPFTNTTLTLNYFIGVESFQYTGAAANAGQGSYVVDTGTSAIILPTAEAEAVNALFNPPAVLNTTIGQYVVSCNATAPQFGVKIGGQVFYLNQQDMFIKYQDGFCFSAVQTSLAAFKLPILGAAFLRSVLAVFDVGKIEMTFMSRMYYEHS